ncbi:MAG: tetratricopeptide repeat protein [Leptolyngbyaceae cyanobacterium bins.59]|nr:tetratricopeptide repeat protein [Leptolyngbyaceae cyanobacterium bins.59]
MEQTFYDQGLERIRRGDLKGAIQQFDRALEINPQFAAAYHRRGGVRFDLGDRQGAIIDYTQALQLNPDGVETYFARGLTRLALGDCSGALEDANQALELNPSYAAACNLQGTAYERLGNIEAAIGSFKRAAQLYLDQKDATHCQRCLNRIKELQIVPVRPVSSIATEDFFKQALDKFQAGDYRRALEDFNWLIQVDPHDARAYCYRGLIYAKTRRSQAAMQDLARVMQMNPDGAGLRHLRGLVRMELGDTRGAIEDFNQLLQNSETSAEAYLYRAGAYARQGDHRQAIEDYSRALSLRPDSPETYCARAATRHQFADLRGALEDYQRAANLYFERQDWPHYRQVLDQLKQLQSLPQTFSGSQAESIPLDVGRESPRPGDWDPSARFHPSTELRDRLLRLVGGNLDIAERLIDLAKQKYPDRPEEWYWERVIADLEQER